MEKKKKILHVLGGMGRGGAPSFIINNMLKMDSHEFQFDFLVRKDNCAFYKEIEAHGGEVYVVPDFPKHLVQNIKETVGFFDKHFGEYHVVHIHANALLYMLPIRLATKKWNCKVIIHSHNTQSNVSALSFLHYFNRKFSIPKECLRLACGKEAGKWMFGDREFEVVNNAIDTADYRYSDSKRKIIREELGIGEDTFVVGNIGRFEYAKNHQFMIEVFSELLKLHNNSLMVLTGQGSLLEEIRKKVYELGISDKVIFTGVRSDSNLLYSAFDVFLMPSYFEGLPFTLVEAQAAGTPCIISNDITTEVDVTNLVTRLKLSDSPNIWASKINSMVMPSNRGDYQNRVAESGYDTFVTAQRLQEIYLGK